MAIAKTLGIEFSTPTDNRITSMDALMASRAAIGSMAANMQRR